MAAIAQTGTLGTTTAHTASSTLTATTSGNAIIVCCWSFTPNGGAAPGWLPSWVTDNLGSSYQVVATSDLVVPSTNPRFDCAVYWLPSCPAGVTSVNFTGDTSINAMCVVAYEVSTPPKAADLSTTAGTSTTVSHTPAVGPLQAAASDVLGVAVLCTDCHGTFTSLVSNGTGWVQGQANLNNSTLMSGACATLVTGVAGATLNESWTITGDTSDGPNAVLLVTFNIPLPPKAGSNMLLLGT